MAENVIEQSRNQKYAKSTFRVTVVEDEEVVRNLCLDIPESLGYEVVFARNGADGLRMFRENSDIFDLTFTDVVMPRLSGVEMARHIRELVGTTPVIFTTGYSRDSLTDLPEGCENSAILRNRYG